MRRPLNLIMDNNVSSTQHKSSISTKLGKVEKQKEKCNFIQIKRSKTQHIQFEVSRLRLWRTSSVLFHSGFATQAASSRVRLLSTLQRETETERFTVWRYIFSNIIVGSQDSMQHKILYINPMSLSFTLRYEPFCSCSPGRSFQVSSVLWHELEEHPWKHLDL